MLDWFNYHGHMCIAFEMLGLSVFDFLVNIELYDELDALVRIGVEAKCILVYLHTKT